jgi:uncharacterized protein (DUF1015 family)
MTILDYNRVLRDLNGRTPEQLLGEIGERFAVSASTAAARPAAAAEVGMFLGGRWHRLKLRADLVPKDDPIGRLPITLLTRNLIEPILGVSDPRTDKRIDFVGGGRGLGELERRVNSGEMAVAFALYPTSMDDLMAVADAGGIIPPKSTWFGAKLADGMVSPCWIEVRHVQPPVGPGSSRRPTRPDLQLFTRCPLCVFNPAINHLQSPRLGRERG